MQFHRCALKALFWLVIKQFTSHLFQRPRADRHAKVWKQVFRLNGNTEKHSPSWEHNTLSFHFDCQRKVLFTSTVTVSKFHSIKSYPMCNLCRTHSNCAEAKWRKSGSFRLKKIRSYSSSFVRYKHIDSIINGKLSSFPLTHNMFGA